MKLGTKHEKLLSENSHIFETDFPLIQFWRLPQISLEENISKITTPTLIIVGAKDALVINKSANNLEKEIKGAKRVSIKDAGHMVNLENPVESNRIVLGFLQSLEVNQTQ